MLPSLLPEFAGQVNLIYIDPPFDTGADFSFTATLPDLPETHEDESFAFTKEPSIIEQKAYRDTWGRGMDSYLQWFYETVVLLHELLAEDGSLYVHLDWHVGHYAKAVLDEVFGETNFMNDIIWHYRTGNISEKQFQRKHDILLLYSKSGSPVFNPIEFKEYYFCIYGPDFKPSFKGRKSGKDEYGEYRISFVDDVWDISAVFTLSGEHTDYPTQKPEALLERIIKASTREPSETYIPDLVLDCFVGSGTTAAVAEKLGRRWIACDLGRFAIHTTRKRLLQIPNVRPFVVQHLGKYERQAWQTTEFGSGGERQEQVVRQRTYIDFILKLYNARSLNGYTWLHGVKGGRMVYVGGVDAPVSVGDVTNIAAEFRRAIGTGRDAPTTNGVDVLGWDFAFELNEVARQQAAAANLNLRFLLSLVT